MHPFKDKAKDGRDVARKRYPQMKADGGGIKGFLESPLGKFTTPGLILQADKLINKNVPNFIPRKSGGKVKKGC